MELFVLFLIGLILFAVSMSLYFLPTLIGFFNPNCHNGAAIFVINLLLGWTLIGWVVALVMALWKPTQPIIQNITVQEPQAPPPLPDTAPPQHEAKPESYRIEGPQKLLDKSNIVDFFGEQRNKSESDTG